MYSLSQLKDLGFFVTSFILSYSFNILFTETNSSNLLNELTKFLESKTSVVCNFDLSFANITMFLNPGVITQSFNPMAELAIPREIPTSETEAEIEIQPVTVETQVSKFSA